MIADEPASLGVVHVTDASPLAGTAATDVGAEGGSGSAVTTMLKFWGLNDDQEEPASVEVVETNPGVGLMLDVGAAVLYFHPMVPPALPVTTTKNCVFAARVVVDAKVTNSS